MTKLFTYISVFITIFTLSGCERDKHAESYLYQQWKVNYLSIDGTSVTLDCDKLSWMSLKSNNKYDAHNECSKITITNTPYTYNTKTNSILLTSISDDPLYIVQLDLTNLVLEQKRGEVIYRFEYIKK